MGFIFILGLIFGPGFFLAYLLLIPSINMCRTSLCRTVASLWDVSERDSVNWDEATRLEDFLESKWILTWLNRLETVWQGCILMGFLMLILKSV